MKKRTVYLLLYVSVICLTVSCGKKETSADEEQYISESETTETSADIELWGKYLNEEYRKLQSEDLKPRSEEMIYEEGKSAYITKADIEKGIAFYQAQGMEEEEARAAAEAYFRESEALYTQAVRAGYSVTEDEIEEHIAALQKDFSDETLSAESKEEMAAIIGQFESEDDYWAYERQVYAGILPVQKYVSDMEREYFENHPKSSDDEWIEYFEDYKKELVKKENFQKK